MRSPEISDWIFKILLVICFLSVCTSLTTSNDFVAAAGGSGDKNKNSHYRGASQHHQIRHHRHYAADFASTHALNRSRHHHRHSSKLGEAPIIQHDFGSTAVVAAAVVASSPPEPTKNPTVSVRNLLSSRENDPRAHRIIWRTATTHAPPRTVTSPKPSYYRPQNSVTFSQKSEKLFPPVKPKPDSDNVRERTFDEIVQEIARLTKRKNKKTTTTTTVAPVTSGLDDDYDYDDDDEPQGDEASEDAGNEDSEPQQLYRHKKVSSFNSDVHET